MKDRLANVEFWREVEEGSLGDMEEKRTVESGDWDLVSHNADTFQTTTPGEYRVFGKRVYFKRGSEGGESENTIR